MSDFEETVDVEVAPEVAYAVWADFAGYSRFVGGVESVQRTGDKLHWVVKVGPKGSEWDADIVVEEPGRRLAWKAPDGPIDTDIRFEPLPGGGTHVIFREHMHDSLVAQATAATPIANRQAAKDLQRYKDLVEGRDPAPRNS